MNTHQALIDRLNLLEGQVNALAQTNLYLIAALEQSGALDGPRLEAALRQRRWAHNPLINRLARPVLAWLCDQLAEARSNRWAAQRH